MCYRRPWLVSQYWSTLRVAMIAFRPTVQIVGLHDSLQSRCGCVCIHRSFVVLQLPEADQSEVTAVYLTETLIDVLAVTVLESWAGRSVCSNAAPMR